MKSLYSLLYTLMFIVALPYFIVAGLIRSKYFSSAKERFGYLPLSLQTDSPTIWVHAVSVGEFLAAKRLIRELKEEYKWFRVLVSTTTITGNRLAQQNFPDSVFFFPFDWKWCIQKVLQRLNPSIILIMETEVWPNLIWEAKDRNIPVILVNGRISDRSYPRYRVLRKWLPRFTECWMQTEEDARRIHELDMPFERIQVMGNLKFDFQPPNVSSTFVESLRGWKQSSLLWIAGSTMPGEEEVLLEVFRDLVKQFSLKLMIAPRHPDRFSETIQKARSRGFTCARRSAEDFSSAQVLVLDTIGELASSYEAADLVFIGGTLFRKFGGHNPVEPAFFEKAIFSGPFFSSFQSIYDEFRKAGAIVVSNNLKETTRNLLLNPAQRKAMGETAKMLVEKNCGATNFVIKELGRYLHAEQAVQSNSKISVR
jgi:3-deoxy-D-manno-octulosonic-acid transferase